MKAKDKVIVIALAGIILVSAILLYSWADSRHSEEKPAAMLEVQPKNFTIYEGGSVSINLSFKDRNGKPISADVEWQISATGNTGKITYPPDVNVSSTNSSGMVSVIYHAPDDVDVMNLPVKILAKAIWNGKNYTAEINGTIKPILHNTTVSISSTRKKMIAGETCHIEATLIGYIDEKWKPLANKTVKFTFFEKENGSTLKKVWEKIGTTNPAGKVEVPFFISDVNSTADIICSAKFERNLSGETDYEGCSRLLNITVVPEKPGDFPVVLIHGWIGSTTNWLLNYTWWNLSQELQQKGFKLLDFDVSKPGIQFLAYEPDWQDHHISWIAARVSEKIEQALVWNGYPPNQTIDIVAHSMGGLVSRFMAEHGGADVDYWNDSWMPGDDGYPWYGDGDPDVHINGEQIDDLIAVGTPCHGVPPGINESIQNVIGYLYFPSWIAQVPDMIYHSKFLEAMGYNGTDMVDYYGVGCDIGFIAGMPMDFDGDGIAHTSDGLVPTESPYLTGKAFYILEGKAWPAGDCDHISEIAINQDVHDYIIEHLI